MIKFMHIADLHMGSGFRMFPGKEERLRQYQISALTRITSEIIKRAPHILLVAGDLFDDSSAADPQAAGVVEENFSRIAGEGIKILIVPGTHDSAGYAGSIFRKKNFGALHIFSSPEPERILIETPGGPVNIWGFSYRPGYTGTNPLELIKAQSGVNLLLAHASVIFNPEWKARSKDFPVTPGDLDRFPFDYWALGHYHGYQELYNSSKKLIGAYPGIPFSRSFSEPGEGFIIYGEIKAGAGVSLTKIKVSDSVFISGSLDMAGIKSDESLKKILLDKYPGGCFLKLVLEGSASYIPDTDSLSAGLSDRFSFISLIDETLLVSPALEISAASESAIMGDFIKKIRTLIAEAPDEESRSVRSEALRRALYYFGRAGDNNR